jgi:stage II sporulation protein D
MNLRDTTLNFNRLLKESLIYPEMMISEEPKIHVGILDRCREARGRLNGPFLVNGRLFSDSAFRAETSGGDLILTLLSKNEVVRGGEIRCVPAGDATFTLSDVTIGVRFHWERKEDQVFQGSLLLLARKDGTVTAVNETGLENYLASVISSEMNPGAPMELLKAHAVTSRSWLVSMLERAPEGKQPADMTSGMIEREGERLRWYGREDHDFFNVCADDHCQRYQGITKIIPERAARAVEETRGVFLVDRDEICDARYHKACGGITEDFQNVWENRTVPYLTSVPDSPVRHPPVRSEEDAERWILSRPHAWCRAGDAHVLGRILPSFDQETVDFFRWKVAYDRQELEAILKEKSGIDFGVLQRLVPLERGPSGRIVRLKIEGSKASWVVGKELEIRRWLSRSHLLSSAFIVSVERDASGTAARFILSGAGWGHGVGLCQIGAAMMAEEGFKAEDILKHYFLGAELKKLY